MALVLDTSALFAAHVSDEDEHSACRALIEAAAEPLVIPAPVFVELEYLFRRRATMRAWLELAEDVAAGAFTVYPLDGAAVLAVARLQERYHDLPLGFVDGAVFVACAALGEEKVATLDRRHFSILRNDAGRALQLLPAI